MAESQEINKIVALLRKADKAYYNSGKPLLTDVKYDELKDYLREVEPAHPYLNEIGTEVIKEKVELPYFASSLDKIVHRKNASFTKENTMIDKWLTRSSDAKTFVLSDKLDGISGILHLNRPKLSLYTRGTGSIGQDISHLIPYLNIPKLKKNICVRGELIISKENFMDLQTDFSNARNTVSGTITAKTPSSDIISKIDFVAYDIMDEGNRGTPLDNLEVLETLGFLVVPWKEIKKKELNIESLNNYYMNRYKESEYDLDGIVVSKNYNFELPVSGLPKESIAFKSDDALQTAVVTVKEVLWEVSKDKLIKPRVVFDPVQLDGVKIQKATAFNAKFVSDYNIGVGAQLLIVRSNSVIPDIMEVIKPALVTQMPDIPYDWNDTKVDIIVREDEADEKTISIIEKKQISNFFSKLDCFGVSDATYDKLYDSGLKTIQELKLAQPNDFIGKGIGLKKAQSIYQAIQDCLSSATFVKLMQASNIFGRGFGEQRLNLILEAFPKLQQGKIPSYGDLLEIEGIGEVMAIQFLQSLPLFFEFIEKNQLYSLNQPINSIQSPVTTTSLDTKLFDIICVMSGFRDKELKQEIIEKGGQVSESISKKVNILIVKDKNESTSKIQKARDLGIQILSKDEFVKNYLN